MTATTETTAGQELAAVLRRYFSLGTRTRRYRTNSDGRRDMHHAMTQALIDAAQYPGYFSEATETALRPGFATALAYEKHVIGCRIDGTLAYQINSMSAWRFSSLLGEMVDAGVTCTGDGERFFAEMARKTLQAA
jgi:hypothetical protein